MRLLIHALLAAALAGCASNSVVLIGQSRSVIEDWRQVAIVTEMPNGAEEIAVIRASSSSGATRLERAEYAINKMRKEAAKLGANTLVLSSATAEKKKAEAAAGNLPGGGISGGRISFEEEIIEGIGVYTPGQE